jgi:hypothetical protein
MSKNGTNYLYLTYVNLCSSFLPSSHSSNFIVGVGLYTGKVTPRHKNVKFDALSIPFSFQASL